MAMIKSLTLFHLSLIFILMTTQAIAMPAFNDYICVNEKGNYTDDSFYKENLGSLMTSLPATNGNGYGFYSDDYGRDIYKVYAIALCRGDVKADTCRKCLKNATNALPVLCPNQTEAVGWYNECMLHYSNTSLRGTLAADSLQFLFGSGDNVTSDAEDFYVILQKLLDGLKNRAISGGSLQKFATGNVSAPGFVTIYALVQCTPDLSKQDCTICLDDNFKKIQNFYGKNNGRVVGASCNSWYQTSSFYEPTQDAPLEASPPSTPPTLSPPPALAPQPPGKGRNNKNNSRTLVIGVVSTGVALLSVALVLSVCMYVKRRKKMRATIQARTSNNPVRGIESGEVVQYNFETIGSATDNFSEANKLGEGGFGPVYKGRLSSGDVIAVKRLSTESSQGDLEFKNEVMLVAKLQHRNLARLFGFSLKGSERLLVYEFVPNGSLDNILFDPKKRTDLGWDQRQKIIGGIARGLLYLHEDSRLRMVHRDLKASNILLDEEMLPKISDFGMARLFLVDQSQCNTSRIVGTYGYMAPEYILRGQFSVKSDVFSFGVVLLEIVSGQMNNCFCHGSHEEDLLIYTWRNWRNGTTSNVVDPLLKHGQGSEIMRCIHIALLCVQENMVNRPTMNTIILMLNSNSLSLPMPSEPAFSIRLRNPMDNNTSGSQWDCSKSESAEWYYAKQQSESQCKLSER